MKRIAILLVAAGLAAPASAHEPDRHGLCSTIEVTAPGLKRQPRNLHFATSRILDLDFETRLEKPVYGDHVLRFKVFTPSGFLYQDLNVPFTWPRPKRGRGSQAPADEGVRPAAHYPPGLPVQVLGPTSGRHWHDRTTLSTRLPVAGTSITMSTLYGRWTVQAYLDDDTRPCSPRRPFTIQSK